MIRLTCNSCGTVHELNSMDDFSSCSCGSELTPELKAMISDVYCRILEVDYELHKQAGEGLCGDFSVTF